MTDWKEICTHPKLIQAVQLAGCAGAACLLASSSFNGVRIPLNTALSAALSPLAGMAVLAGSAVTYALTGMLQEQPILLCALTLATIIRWILGVSHTPRAAAMLAAGSTFLSAVIFGLAGLIGGTDWLLWSFGSILSGGLAFCIRRVLMRFESGLPVRLLEADTLPFSVCCIILLSALCAVKLVMISFGELFAGFLILTAAKRYRTAGGVYCGTLAACALVLADGKTAGYAALLPAAGLAAGWLSGKTPLLSYLAVQGVSGLGLLLSQHAAAVSNAWIGGMIGGLAFLFLPAGQLADAVIQWCDSDADLAALTEARMDFLSHAIAGVRGSAERIAGKMNIRHEAEDLPERVCTAVCSKCRSRSLCWERGDTEVQHCFRLLADAAPAEHLSAPFGCVLPDRITEEFARLKRQDAYRRACGVRLHDSQAMLFSQLRITEELLHRAGQHSQSTYHRELTRYVTDILKKYGTAVQAAAVTVSESQRMMIELYMSGDAEPDTELITECLQDALQKPLQCCGIERAGDAQRVILQTAGGFTVTTAAAQCAVHEDEPCGDCWDTFSDSSGAVYLTVSDGMGSGKHAAVESRIVLSSFRQLVQSGMDCREAACLINSIMLTKSGEERFATLDVAKICTDTAAVTLYKYGAGPTFIRHGNRVTLCQAATPPIGIFPQTEPYTTVMRLEQGDMLFLLSDGLDDTLYPYIRKRIRQGGDLQTLAHMVCARAQRDEKGDPQDDVTVLAASITGAVIDE